MFEGKSCTIAYILGTRIFIVSIFGGFKDFFFLFETVLYFLMYST